MTDKICKCGHYKAIHYFYEWSADSICTEGPKCKCREFQLDNLRYLEAEYKDRIRK